MAKKGRTRASKEDRLIHHIDQLAWLEDIVENMPAELRKDLMSGMETEALMKKYAPLAAARQIATAMREAGDRGDRAASQVLDRAEGKPTQKTENTHKYDGVNDEQLTALLKSKLTELIEGPELH